jgi:hypothetical protein
MRLTFQLADGELTSTAAFLGEETLAASFRRVLRVRGLVITATVAAALHPGVTATRGVLARVAESAVGMTSAPVDRPQPTVDLSAVELDLAA